MAIKHYRLVSFLLATSPVSYRGSRNWTWAEVYAQIELERLELPEQWGKFLESVRLHGIKFPIWVSRRPQGRLRVRDGHHRVWAAIRLGLATVPVKEEG
jgi:hypothetical protein